MPTAAIWGKKNRFHNSISFAVRARFTLLCFAVHFTVICWLRAFRLAGAQKKLQLTLAWFQLALDAAVRFLPPSAPALSSLPLLTHIHTRAYANDCIFCLPLRLCICLFICAMFVLLLLCLFLWSRLFACLLTSFQLSHSFLFLNSSATCHRLYLHEICVCACARVLVCVCACACPGV